MFNNKDMSSSNIGMLEVLWIDRMPSATSTPFAILALLFLLYLCFLSLYSWYAAQFDEISIFNGLNSSNDLRFTP